MRSLSQFVCFAAVARNLGFAAAARELGLAPSSVAKSVARLEAQLGSKLFQRTTREVRLTHEGETLYERCAHVLEEIDALERDTMAQTSQPEGLIKVSAPIGYGDKVIVPAVGRLLRANPRLRVDLRLLDERVDLIKEGLDAVIRFGHLSDSRLVARKLDDQQLILCASPSYLERRGTPTELEDLRGHELLAFRQPTSGRDRPFEFKVGAEKMQMKFESRFQINQGAALVDAMLCDCGIGQVPEFLVVTALNAGTLVELIPEARPDALAVNVVTAGPRILAPRVRVFLDLLLSDALRGQGYAPPVASLSPSTGRLTPVT